MDATSLAYILGTAGSAVGRKGSWQQRLGSGIAGMASQDQARKFLSEMLGGGQASPKGAKTGSQEQSTPTMTLGQLDALDKAGLGEALSGYFDKSAGLLDTNPGTKKKTGPRRKKNG